MKSILEIVIVIKKLEKIQKEINGDVHLTWQDW